jgi:hypothetical protein
VPPIEDDELISSWLARIACFYGQSVSVLFSQNGVGRSVADLAAIDMGRPRTAIKPLARLLNITVDRLAEHTISSAYPWASELVTRESFGVPSDHNAPLRPAVCPRCLEQQRAMRGFSWLRREWVLAWRTMCRRHASRLIEGVDETAHPAWQDFFHRHKGVQLATCPGTLDVRAHFPPPPSREAEVIDALNGRLVDVQDALVAEAAFGKPRLGGAKDRRTGMARDLLWALTRVDRGWPDRPVYESFALPQFDSAWHIARRRRIGLIDYSCLGVHVRHAILAAAVALAVDPDLYPSLLGSNLSRLSELGRLLAILRQADADELRKRSAEWPEPERVALCHGRS